MARTNPMLMYTPRDGLRPPILQLSDTSEYHDGIETYKHLDKPVVERLLLYAADKDMVKRQQALHNRYWRSRELFDNRASTVSTIIGAEEEYILQQLDVAHEEEVAYMEKVLDQALENDIRAIQEMHQQTLESERHKLHSKFCNKRAAAAKFFEEQKKSLLESHEDSDRSSLAVIQHELEAASLKVDEVFGSSEYLIRLLILAEDLEAESLRDSCIDYLAQPRCFPQFALL